MGDQQFGLNGFEGLLGQGLKMHWSPEHAQRPEEYLDISFTTSAPAHKAEDNSPSRPRHRYVWANDDISALTASNLLKRFAEKYSGLVHTSHERAELNTYADGPFAPVNEQKNENDTWRMSLHVDDTYSVNSAHNGLSGTKVATNSTLPPGGGTVGIGGSSVVTSSHSESRYPSDTTLPGIPSSLQPQEYSSGYNGTYLPSAFCSQTTSAVSSSYTSPINSSSLLQPAHPPPAMVPSYSSALAGVSPLYNYPSNSYPCQTSIGPGYAGVQLPSSYLPSGIAAPIPLPPLSRPPIGPGYDYQSHNVTPSSVAPANNGSSSNLKRRDLAAKEGEGTSRYSYGQHRIPSGPYRLPVDGALDDCTGNEFRPDDVEFMGKQHITGDLIGKYEGHEQKRVMPPLYRGEECPLRSRSTEAIVKFAPALMNREGEDDRGDVHAHQMQLQRVEPASSQLEEQFKSLDSQLLSLVTNEIVDCGPPVQWDDIAGMDTAKAVIEEHVLWPLMRPRTYAGGNGPPKSILLFGPRGGHKTMLTRCIATHLGATFLKVSGSSFISKWKDDGEMILQAMFLIARSRQPSVIFINELDAMLSGAAGEGGIHLKSIKAKLLSHVEGVINSNSDHIIVIAGTRHPNNIEETIHRYFVKRLYISPPDSIARHQILIAGLSQQDHCLSDGEIGSIVQHTEGYSGSDLAHLCQQAALGRGRGPTVQLQPTTYEDFENALRKVQPSVSQKELELYTEWSKLFGTCV
ncbi:fidgetin-like isoform X2 [Scyliorhinus canicula]|uniref:fidgetin-like isoform X2 n=1 Tax=Scyliorhinus canicula TaxID=7830 RepID=UPI0018F69600|nr:fidgetin-like isoform X2 [Scyliorhinus canicula]